MRVKVLLVTLHIHEKLDGTSVSARDIGDLGDSEFVCSQNDRLSQCCETPVSRGVYWGVVIDVDKQKKLFRESTVASTPFIRLRPLSSASHLPQPGKLSLCSPWLSVSTVSSGFLQSYRSPSGCLRENKRSYLTYLSALQCLQISK